MNSELFRTSHLQVRNFLLYSCISQGEGLWYSAFKYMYALLVETGPALLDEKIAGF